MAERSLEASSDPSAPAKPRKRQRRIPRRINPGYLERAALFHLERFGSSVANLRRVLERKIDRSCAHHGGERADHADAMEAVLVKLQRLGALDDRRYAASVLRRLRTRGLSRRHLHARLRSRGVPDEISTDLLAESTERDPDFAGACRLARRRRLGPYRMDETARAERRQRDLAALGRAGFGYAIALRVIDAEDVDAVEQARAEAERPAAETEP